MPRFRLHQQPKFWAFCWGGWFLVLLALSSLPGGTLTYQPFDFFDKLEHAGYFAAGGFCVGAWLVTRGDWPRRWWWPLAMAAAVGALDEWRQQFTPGRSALDLGDWIADVVGGILGTFIVAAGPLRRRLLPEAAGEISGQPAARR